MHTPALLQVSSPLHHVESSQDVPGGRFDHEVGIARSQTQHGFIDVPWPGAKHVPPPVIVPPIQHWPEAGSYDCSQRSAASLQLPRVQVRESVQLRPGETQVPAALQVSSPSHQLPFEHEVPIVRLVHAEVLEAMLQYWQGLLGFCAPSA
jgi:hypothetical protein